MEKKIADTPTLEATIIQVNYRYNGRHFYVEGKESAVSDDVSSYSLYIRHEKRQTSARAGDNFKNILQVKEYIYEFLSGNL